MAFLLFSSPRDFTVANRTFCDAYKVQFLDSSRKISVVVLFVVLFVCLFFGEAGYDESQQDQFVD